MSAVAVDALLADIKRRRARLPAEIGAFIALLALYFLEIVWFLSLETSCLAKDDHNDSDTKILHS